MPDYQRKFGRHRTVMKGTLPEKPKQLFCRCLPPYCSGVTETAHLAHLIMQFQCLRNRSVTKDTLLVKPKQFFVPLSPLVAARCLKLQSWHPLIVSYYLPKFGRNRAVMKATLLMRPQQFFIPTSTRSAVPQTPHVAAPPLAR
jgi:hypothetical protein